MTMMAVVMVVAAVACIYDGAAVMTVGVCSLCTYFGCIVEPTYVECWQKMVENQMT